MIENENNEIDLISENNLSKKNIINVLRKHQFKIIIEKKIVFKLF